MRAYLSCPLTRKLTARWLHPAILVLNRLLQAHHAFFPLIPVLSRLPLAHQSLLPRPSVFTFLRLFASHCIARKIIYIYLISFLACTTALFACYSLLYKPCTYMYVEIQNNSMSDTPSKFVLYKIAFFGHLLEICLT